MQFQLSLSITLAALLQSTQACIHHNRGQVSLHEVRSQIRNRSIPPLPLKTAIQNVRVFDGECFTKPQTVVFENGFITDDLEDVEAFIDASGQYLIPGLIDAHVHVFNFEALENITSYGVTTALNMGCTDYDINNALRDQVGLADFLSAGYGAVGANTSNGALQPAPDHLVYDDSDVVQLVDWVFGNKSDFHKLINKPASITQLQQDEMVATAHRKFNRQTMTHAADMVAFDQAVASQTDGLQHIPDDGLISKCTIARMREQGQFITPTMTVFKIGYGNPLVYAFLGRSNNTNATYANVERNVRLLHDAGIPVLAGTDAVGFIAPGIDVPWGLTLHGELELLHGVGLTTLEALRAATTESAKRHRLQDRGSIEIGKRADLVLLNSDPLQNISNTRDIARVWARGVEVQKVRRLAVD